MGDGDGARDQSLAARLVRQAEHPPGTMRDDLQDTLVSQPGKPVVVPDGIKHPSAQIVDPSADHRPAQLRLTAELLEVFRGN